MALADGVQRGGRVSAPPAPNCILDTLRRVYFYDYEDKSAVFCAQAVWDALLAEGTIRYEGRDRLIHNYPARTWQPVLVLPLAGLDTDTPT